LYRVLVRRSVAIAIAAGLFALSAAGCTQSERMALVCEHCACSASERDAMHPVGCDVISLEQWMHCCIADGS
jgi:hypothetical protein